MGDIRETTKILKPTLMWAIYGKQLRYLNPHLVVGDIRETTKILKPTLMWAIYGKQLRYLNPHLCGRYTGNN